MYIFEGFFQSILNQKKNFQHFRFHSYLKNLIWYIFALVMLSHFKSQKCQLDMKEVSIHGSKLHLWLHFLLQSWMDSFGFLQTNQQRENNFGVWDSFLNSKYFFRTQSCTWKGYVSDSSLMQRLFQNGLELKLIFCNF